MIKVGLFCPSLVPGDAISNDTVAMFNVLKKLGYQAYIFSNHATIQDLKVHHPYEAITLLKNYDDVMIYQHGCGYYDGVAVLNSLYCRKIVKFHNITPVEWFKEDKIATASAAEGLRQTVVLMHHVPEFWVASEFSGEDLKKMGKKEYAVIPPFHHIQDLVDAKGDGPVYDKTKFNIVMVGRVVPHKNLEAGLKMAASYKEKYGSDFRFIIVGSLDYGSYVYELKRLVIEMGLEENVIMTGKVSTAQLKGIYETADVMLMTSKHEGFCVPLIEAMAHGVPVISNTETALPSTGGDAVVYVHESEHKQGAEALHKIRTDKSFAEQLKKAGLKRYQDSFTNAKIEEKFLHYLNNPCSHEKSLKMLHQVEHPAHMLMYINRYEKEFFNKQRASFLKKLQFVAGWFHPKTLFRRLRYGDEVSQDTMHMFRRMLLTQVNTECELLSEIYDLKRKVAELESKVVK